MVEWLDAGLRRVRAKNASPMTFTGTASYIVGRGRVAVIDPGPDDPAHLAALLAALDHGESVSHILVTHAHRDHSGLAPALARATRAPVLAFGDATSGRSRRMERLAREGLVGGGEGVDAAFRPDVTLADGTRVEGEGWDILTLHAPGHFGNHMVFLKDGNAFTGDLAMGWASTLISPPDGDLAAFRASLARLLALDLRRLYPGHGEPVADGPARLRWLLDHRDRRDRDILAALSEGPRTIPELARAIYRDTPAPLLLAAERNILAHLIDLADKNLIIAEPGALPSARFRGR